ncbi:alpha-ketoglutarate decarboxylase [uncultured Psychroserpens sp.]|uniref:alpha-ketoglutarate decarboxylase n=1 Tax=uncultured Psychroserpens sp. TaxID=255436 RepID=UPI00260D4A3D|nr:alpha-ketoglutarate decarboxylase [uncultured Psychroserpens sp.]
MKFPCLFNLKSVVILSVIMSFSFNSFSQDSTNDFWSHVRFGGGLGLSFGDGFFSGTIAPSAIYQFNSDFALGLGLNGTYNSLKNTYNSTIFGASVISLYNPIPEIQLSGEFEELNVNRKFENNQFENQNYWYPALFLGVGYRSNNVTLGIRYDVLYDRDKSIYADPWAPFVRVFF